MEETQNTSEDIVPEEQAVPKKVMPKSNEALLGTIIFLVMILFVLACLGALGWGGYSFWQKRAQEKNEPSIAALATDPEGSASEQGAPQEDVAKPAEEASSDASLASAKSATISVLNGGAAKGTAGVATDFLKEKGFTKVTAGNTLGNFSGTTVYYDAKSEKEAGAIQKVLIEKYPATAIKPAVATDKETSVSPITVIFGK